MGSHIYATKCPCCGRSAIENSFYNTGEKYTFCLRCGYNYSKTIEYDTEKNIEYREVTKDGHGVFILKNKEGGCKNVMLNSNITNQIFEEYKVEFMNEKINQEKSYLVSFKDGIFTVLLGNPPENFYLAYEEYRERMFVKYGVPEDEFMVPVEE